MRDDSLHALLEDVARPYRSATRFAMLCAACAAIAGILLLGLAGWFITGAALAGAAGIAAIQAFNYLLPSAAIRLLAIARTITRYGERLYGHKAALSALALFRVRLFETLIAKPLADGARTNLSSIASTSCISNAARSPAPRASSVAGLASNVSNKRTRKRARAESAAL
jgi:ATP-binding cassette subfamily C protein CydC